MGIHTFFHCAKNGHTFISLSIDTVVPGDPLDKTKAPGAGSSRHTRL